MIPVFRRQIISRGQRSENLKGMTLPITTRSKTKSFSETRGEKLSGEPFPTRPRLRPQTSSFRKDLLTNSIYVYCSIYFFSFFFCFETFIDLMLFFIPRQRHKKISRIFGYAQGKIKFMIRLFFASFGNKASIMNLPPL